MQPLNNQPPESDHPQQTAIDPSQPSTAAHGFANVDEAIAAHAQTIVPSDEQPRKRSNLKLPVLLLGVLLLLSGGSFGAYTLWSQQNSPERVFKDMLANSMNVSTFKQTYTIDSQDKEGTVKVKAVLVMDSDFSNIAKPKMKAMVTAEQQIGDLTTSRKGEIIALGNGESYFKLNEVNDGTTGDDAAALYGGLAPADIKGTWIASDESLAPELVSFPLFFVGLPVDLLNSVHGELTIGNVAEPLRSELLAFHAQNPTYTIVNSEEVDLNGRKTLKYELTLDTEKIREYNSKLPPVKDSSEGKVEYAGSSTFYIDIATRMPARVIVEQDGTRATIDYSDFGQQLDIKKPEASKTATEVFSL